MNIIQTSTVENITISVGDRWNIGNNITIVLKEIFEIDGMIYVSTITENHPMMSLKISKDTQDVVTPNRYINSAELWIKKNTKLFETI